MNRERVSRVREEHRELQRSVSSSVERKIRHRDRPHRRVWFGLGMFGLVGWSIAVPTLLGIGLGIWIDRRWPSPLSWTLMLLVLGMVVGCFHAWTWIRKERLWSD